MRIAVTGASGFIGEYLCPYLQHHLQADIITITRNPSASSLTFQASDEQLIGSLNNKIDCLIHLAARAHTHSSTAADFKRDNLDLCERIANIAIAANIPRVIYISSIKVNGNSTTGRQPYSADEQPMPEDEYGKSKLASEILLTQKCSHTKTQLVIIRPPLVYGFRNKGNLRSLTRLIHRKIPLPVANIHNKRDLVSLQNLCNFIALTVKHPNATGNTFLISDGLSRNTNEIVHMLARQENISVKTFSIPQWIFNFLKVIKPASIERLTGDLQVDIDKTKTLLNWSPLP